VRTSKVAYYIAAMNKDGKIKVKLIKFYDDQAAREFACNTQWWPEKYGEAVYVARRGMQIYPKQQPILSVA